ncbi:MAG: cob(I)yrinic acid a,c-diamide adenosyltransferase, partial [Ilumatobacteraceae bacterium]
ADRAHAADGWKQAAESIRAGENHLVVLDELTYLVSFHWLDVGEIVEAIKNRPAHVNIIITGRDAAPEIIEIADTVTEMREIKHAYQQGIRAMRGLDY